MKQSINHPWAITEKHVSRYGDLWATLDFEFNDKITTEQFKIDPMNTEAGNLIIDNRSLDLRYKDILAYSKEFEEMISNVYASNANKQEVYEVLIKGRTFQLKRHELAKLATTLSESAHAISRKYELGLYL
jgi:hypothetical protein